MQELETKSPEVRPITRSCHFKGCKSEGKTTVRDSKSKRNASAIRGVPRGWKKVGHKAFCPKHKDTPSVLAYEVKVKDLQALMPRGSTVYVINRHTSRSGMLRSLVPVVMMKGGHSRYPWWNVAEVLGWPKDLKRDAIKVSGAGMDMGFHLVYSIASALYDDGYALNARWL